jgi:predicted nucleotidyltransferase
MRAFFLMSAGARYFVAKCNNFDSLRKGVETNSWAAPEHKKGPQPYEVLSAAFSTCGQVNILFSVNGSRGWQGHAVMKSLPTEPTVEDRQKGDCWHRFQLEWKCLSQHYATVYLSYDQTEDMVNAMDYNNPVNKARNWQEVPSECGEQLCLQLQALVQDDEKKRKRNAELVKQQMPPPFLSLTDKEMLDTGCLWQRMNEKVEQYGRIILACSFGSQRYNLHNADSDLDMYVVYMADTRKLLSFNPPPQTIKNRESEKPDFTVHELFKYCELLLAGDPRTVETLFLDDNCIYHASDSWHELKKKKELLLSRVLVDKYTSDALGERGWKKMQKWLMKQDRSDLLAARINKLFYIILRLLFHAKQIATGQKYQVFFPPNTNEYQLLQSVRSGQVPHGQLTDTIERSVYLQRQTNRQECA